MAREVGPCSHETAGTVYWTREIPQPCGRVIHNHLVCPQIPVRVLVAVESPGQRGGMRLLITGLLAAGALTCVSASSAPSAGPTIDLAEQLTPRHLARTEPTVFGWPLAGGHEVTRPFDAPITTYGPGHRGVDLAGRPGSAVLAAGDGLVLYAGTLAGRSVVSIEHRGGLRTTYEPVAPAVTVGQHVGRGQEIGRLEPGHPECAAPAPMTCLHWGARRRLHYLDPLRLLGRSHVRLLPWDSLPRGGSQ